MKKILLSLLLLVLWPSTLFSDVIPEDSHYVDRYVYITNISAFSDIVLIGYITGPVVENYEVYLVKENEPLDKGYKFNYLGLFALKKSVLDRAGNLENMNFKEIAEKLPPAKIIDPGGQYVTNDNPLESEYYYYSIQGVTETALTLKLDKRVLTYNNGSSDRIITY
jgi:hypothetical protein